MNFSAEPTGFVHERAKDIEDHDLDVADLCHCAFPPDLASPVQQVTTLPPRRITGQDGDVRFEFVSGSPALDLAGTVLSRQDDPVDLLATPTNLEQWMGECDELPDRVTVDTTTFESALTLREAIYQLALCRVIDRPFDPSSLAIINDAASGPLLTFRLSDAGLHLSGDGRAVLSHMARKGIALLADPRAVLKECGRTGCSRVYLDRSRGARRTWCGMDQCGNRVKAAAYRARKRTTAGAEHTD